jgi:hypothetical protein
MTHWNHEDHPDHQVEHELAEIRREVREILRLLRHHPHHPHNPNPNHFTLRITPMAIGNIVAGQSGTFALSLLLNGAADTVDTVSAVTWSSPDPTVTVAPAADGLSAVFTVPATDTATTLVANAAATVTIVAGSPSTLPVGTTASASGSASVPVSPASTPQTFTLEIEQKA